MKILVTGGTGFIGGHVVDRIGADGDEPVVFDRHVRSSSNATMLGDIRDFEQISGAVSKVDGVIHLAGVLGTQETVHQPRLAAETNIMGGLNVLEACHQSDVPLAYIAVGNYWMDNGYSISKTTVERYCRMYREEHGLTVAIIRAMNAYGPRQVPSEPFGPSRVRKITPAFICRALTNQPIEIYGDGEQVMDMIYVTDVADALVNAVGTIDEWDVGTQVDTTVNEIANTVLAIVDSDMPVSHLPMRPGEPEHSVVLADTPWPEAVSLEEGLGRTVAWYRDHWLPTWRS
jgi:UDP-glucose 4-epimerase